MAYVETNWIANTPMNPTNLNHLNEQMAEMRSYLTSHNHDDLYNTKTYMESTYYYAANDGHGSGANAETIDGYSLIELTAAIPTGVIIWYWEAAGGPIANLSGWQLADGTNGTRDLRERYVQGSGQYDVGDTGGANTILPAGNISVAGHILTLAQLPVHAHGYLDTHNTYIGSCAGGSTYASTTRLEQRDSGYAGKSPADAHTHTGTLTVNGGVAYEKRPNSKVVKHIQRV